MSHQGSQNAPRGFENEPQGLPNEHQASQNDPQGLDPEPKSVPKEQPGSKNWDETPKPKAEIPQLSAQVLQPRAEI